MYSTFSNLVLVQTTVPTIALTLFISSTYHFSFFFNSNLCPSSLQAIQVPHSSNQSSFSKSYDSYLNLDILPYSPSIYNKSFLKVEVINRFRYTFSSQIFVEPKRHFGRSVSHSLMLTCVSIACGNNAFLTLLFLKKSSAIKQSSCQLCNVSSSSNKEKKRKNLLPIQGNVI